MRGAALLFFSLPLASGLSLANFQDITSSTIPLSCQLIYDEQIPSCVVADFSGTAGCSIACQSALLGVATDVITGCSGVKVSSKTLLGIIANGGILGALCTALQTSTVAVPQTTLHTTAVAQSSAAADSVTLPTGSPGVIVASATTSASKATSTTKAETTSVQKTTSSKGVSVASLSSSSALSSAGGGIGGSSSQSTSTQIATVTAPTSTLAVKTSSSSTSKTTATKPAATQQSSSQSQEAAGGSPFDIASSASRISGRSIAVFAVAAMLLVR